MAFPGLQTPQRPLPGAFFNTPAASRFDPRPPIPPIFRSNQQQFPAGGGGAGGLNPPAQQQQQAPEQQQPTARALQPIQRAAKTISDVLARESLYPDLDSYVRRK
jgi:nuclear pore complex protein Nup155